MALYYFLYVKRFLMACLGQHIFSILLALDSKTPLNNAAFTEKIKVPSSTTQQSYVYSFSFQAWRLAEKLIILTG